MVLGVTSMVTGSRSSAPGEDHRGLFLVAGHEVGDVGDGTDRLVHPVRTHPVAGLQRALGDVDRMQQWGVGAVELDQCPGERPLQRLALQRLRLPGPRHHGADAGHRNHLGQGLVGDGVILGGRYVHPSVRSAYADDPSSAQSR